MKKFIFILIVSCLVIGASVPVFATYNNKSQIAAASSVKKAEGSFILASASQSEESGTDDEAGHGEEPAWKIPGWQFIFGLVAVGYYALALKVLPAVIEDKRFKERH